MKHSLTALLLASSIALVGCATPPAPIPPELQYQVPAASEGTGAIIGSQEKTSFGDDYTVFIGAVDGKRVMVGRNGWNVPLVLAAGNRALLVEFKRGAFVTSAMLNVQVEKDAELELKYSTDVAINNASTYCDFWIVDRSSGTAVTGIARGSVSGGLNNTYIPVVTPRK